MRVRPLTTSVDTVSYTAGNTTGYGVIAGVGNAGASTLQVFDRFSMTGSNNTLEVTLVNDGVPTAGAITAATTPILRGVNHLDVRATVASNNNTLAGGIAPNLTTLHYAAPADNVTFAAIPVAVDTIALSGVAGQDVDVTYTFAAGTAGTANAINLVLDTNGAQAGAVAGDFAIVDINGSGAGQGFEIVNVEAIGANRLDALTVDSTGAAASVLEVLTVSGTGSLRIDTALDFNTTTPVVDASANSGGVNIGFEDAAARDTFIGGSGNDRVAFAATRLNATDSVNGGAGVNTLAIADATLNAAQVALVAGINATQNFQVIEMTAAGGATLAANAVAQTQFVFSGATGAGNTVAVTAIAGDTITLSSNGVAGAVTLAGTVGTTSLGLNLLNAGATAAGGTTLDITGFNTVALDSSSTTGALANTFSGAITNNANAVITVTGNTGLTIDNAGGGFGAAVIYNGAANTGIQTITGSTVADSITGGVNNDVLLGLGGNDVINGGAGRDQITGGTNADTINTGLGLDVLTMAANDTLLTAGGIADGIQLTAAYLATIARAWDIVTVDVGDTLVFTGNTGAALVNGGTNITVSGAALANNNYLYWNDGTNTYVLSNASGGAIQVGDANTNMLIVNGVHTLAAAGDTLTVIS